MCRVNSNNGVSFTPTTHHCPIGEITAKKKIGRATIPVLSCEGACIRGEIARLAAYIVSKGESYGRGCHGELVTVPESAIARWIKTAEKVILIDGCFLRCHGRILENIFDEKTKTLIAIGAATASNCIPCFEHLYEKAVTCGLTVAQIQRAADIGGQVKKGANTAISKSITELMGNEQILESHCMQTENKSCCS